MLEFDWQRPWSHHPAAASSQVDDGDEDVEGPSWNDDTDEEASEPSPLEAGDILAELLLSLKHHGHLTAKQCCVLAYWCTKAGAQGPVSQLSFRPEAPSGHFQRHLDSVVGYKAMDKHLYQISAPGYEKSSATRVVSELQVCPPHESLHREIVANPSIVQEVRDQIAKGMLPPRYTEHPVVREAPSDVTVVPIVIYLDAAPYSTTDSCLGIFCYNTCTEQRHMIVCLRKRQMCKCGCKFWDTLIHIWWFIRWSLECCARGVFPAHRHDGSMFDRGDDYRAVLAGSSMDKVRFACHS